MTNTNPFVNRTGVAPGVEELAKRGVKITGLPFGHQGVEMKAKADLRAQQDQGPQRPMIVNGGMMFGAPASAPAPAAAPAASPALPFGRASAPAVAAAPVNSLSRGAGPRGLGGVAPVRVGRSNFDPQRMAERMVRRRDPQGAKFLFGQAEQQQQQVFQREMFGAQQQAEAGRDARNFDQGVQMFGMQQQAEAGRDARNFDQGVQMFGMQQQAEGQRDARNFDQGMQMFGMQQQAADQRYDRERKDQLSDEQKKQGFSVQPLDPNDPTKGTAILRADGTLFNVLPGERAAPKPSMMQLPGTQDYVPMFGNQQVSGAPLYTQGLGLEAVPEGQAGPPKPVMKLQPKQTTKPERVDISWQDDGNGGKVPFQQIVDPETGLVTVRRVKIVDENGDGVDDRQQGGGAGAGGAAPARPAGQTSSGNKWTPKK